MKPFFMQTFYSKSALKQAARGNITPAAKRAFVLGDSFCPAKIRRGICYLCTPHPLAPVILPYTNKQKTQRGTDIDTDKGAGKQKHKHTDTQTRRNAHKHV